MNLPRSQLLYVGSATLSGEVLVTVPPGENWLVLSVSVRAQALAPNGGVMPCALVVPPAFPLVEIPFAMPYGVDGGEQGFGGRTRNLRLGIGTGIEIAASYGTDSYTPELFVVIAGQVLIAS